MEGYPKQKHLCLSQIQRDSSLAVWYRSIDVVCMDNKTSAALTRPNAKNCIWRLNVTEPLAADTIKPQVFTEEESRNEV